MTQLPSEVNSSRVAGCLDSVKDRGGPQRAERSEALPCLYSNNSIETWAQDYTDQELAVASAAYTGLCPNQKKQADRLYQNIARLISLAPSIGHVAFFTLTFPDKVFTYAEASRRWNSLATNYLNKHPEFALYDRIGQDGKQIVDRKGRVKKHCIWARVGEQHADGAYHFHCLIHLGQDIREGFDFDEYIEWLNFHKSKPAGFTGRRRLNTGNIYLRSLWADLRQNLPRYKFGISELVPLRTNTEAVARYVGKYVSKHVSQRTESGIRVVAYSQGWAKHSMKMAWYTDGSKEWRRKLSLFAQMHGCSELFQLAEKLGPRWAFIHQEDIYNIHQILDERGGVLESQYQNKTTKTAIDRKEARYRREFEPPTDPKKREKWERNRELTFTSRKSKTRLTRESARNNVSRILDQPYTPPDLPPVQYDEDHFLKREWLKKLDASILADQTETKRTQPEGVPF